MAVRRRRPDRLAPERHLHRAAYGDGPIPIPSPADALALSSYPLAYTGFVLLLRNRAERCPASVWIDGAIGSFAVLAIGSAFVIEPLHHAAKGSFASIAVNMAYPLADIVLLALVSARPR